MVMGGVGSEEAENEMMTVGQGGGDHRPSVSVCVCVC